MDKRGPHPAPIRARARTHTHTRARARETEREREREREILIKTVKGENLILFQQTAPPFAENHGKNHENISNYYEEEFLLGLVYFVRYKVQIKQHTSQPVLRKTKLKTDTIHESQGSISTTVRLAERC